VLGNVRLALRVPVGKIGVMTQTVYPPADRPEVEVLVEGTWHYGELRMWTQHRDGSGRRT
jgi:hypothetical protein